MLCTQIPHLLHRVIFKRSGVSLFWFDSFYVSSKQEKESSDRSETDKSAYKNCVVYLNG